MTITTATNILCERHVGSPVPMADSIVACAKAGFTQLDFGFAELAFNSQQFCSDSWEEEITQYAKLGRELGITFVQGHGSIFDFCMEADRYAEQLELLHRSFYGAQMLGIPWLVVHPSSLVSGGQLSADTHRKNVEFFCELAQFARPLGVGIAVENMWDYACPGVPRYATTAHELLQLVQEVGQDNVGACWDVEHASVENLPQGDSIRLLGKHLRATHISDETGRNNIHILPYTGRVKWQEILQAFADINYTGAFSLEIQHYLPQMPLELCPQAMSLAYKVGCHLVEQLEQSRTAG